MNWDRFLKRWAETHPVYDPSLDSAPQQDKILTWLKDGGESPLPTWPKIASDDE